MLACGGGRARALIIYLLAEINVARSNIDFAALERRPPGDVRRWAQRHCKSEGIAALENAIVDQSRLIILVTSFAPHYIGLLTPAFAGLGVTPVAIVQPRVAVEALQALGFYEKLAQAIGRPITTILADNPFALVQSMKALASGAVVAMRIDSLPVRTNSFLVSSLFGKPSAFPASILQMAARAEAVLLPLFVLRSGRSFVSRFGDPVTVGHEAGNKELVDAAAAINSQIQQALLDAPTSYSSWYALYEKMRLAEEVLVQMKDPVA